MGACLASGVRLHLVGLFHVRGANENGPCRRCGGVSVGPRRASRRGAGRTLAARRARVDDDVVDDRGGARLHFVGLNPPVFGEVRGNFEILVVDGAVRGNRIFLAEREDRIGLADAPAVGIDRLRGKVGGVAFGRAGRDPVQNGFFLDVGQAAVVQERAVRRIGVPGRHRALGDLRADRPGPGARVAKSQERHRRNFARPVASRAVLVKDRRDVLGKRRRARGRAGALSVCKRRCNEEPASDYQDREGLAVHTNLCG